MLESSQHHHIPCCTTTHYIYSHLKQGLLHIFYKQLDFHLLEPGVANEILENEPETFLKVT